MTFANLSPILLMHLNFTIPPLAETMLKITKHIMIFQVLPNVMYTAICSSVLDVTEARDIGL